MIDKGRKPSMLKKRLPRVPKLCQRRDGRYYTTDPHERKQIYFNSNDPLGEYEDWRKKYLRRIKEVMAETAAEPPRVVAGLHLTIARLCELYLDHARAWYVKAGQQTSQIAVISMLLRRLNDLFGERQADSLRVADVELLQQRMIDDGLSRRTCNQLLHILRNICKWAVQKEVMSGETLGRVLVVPTLRKGRTQAKERKPVRAVPLEAVEKTLPHLPAVYQAMVQLQLYSAMRPGEVQALSADQIDQSDATWEYVPERYKTEHHHEGDDDPRRRRIFFGPQARSILSPLLDACTDPSRPLFRRPNGKPMTDDAYYYAIGKACEKAGIPRWAPNQLRHRMATAIREKFGREAAQDYLGHENPQTTLLYAERSHSNARRIAEDMG